MVTWGGGSLKIAIFAVTSFSNGPLACVIYYVHCQNRQRFLSIAVQSVSVVYYVYYVHRDETQILLFI